jgi:hypothetical protein
VYSITYRIDLSFGRYLTSIILEINPGNDVPHPTRHFNETTILRGIGVGTRFDVPMVLDVTRQDELARSTNLFIFILSPPPTSASSSTSANASEEGLEEGTPSAFLSTISDFPKISLVLIVSMIVLNTPPPDDGGMFIITVKERC